MEPITLLGAIIVLFGLWVEFEPVIMRVTRVISGSIETALTTPAPVQKPAYVKYMTGIGT